MIEIHMQDMLKELQKLPVKVQKRVVNGAAKAGAKVIAKEAKRLVPVRTGALKDSITVFKAKSKKKNYVVYDISPVGKTITKRYKLADGSKWSIKGDVDPFYAHFIEFGTYAKLDHPLKKAPIGEKAERRRKIVEKGGGIAPHPFMRPAFENKAEESIEAFKNYMRQKLDKELSK